MMPEFSFLRWSTMNTFQIFSKFEFKLSSLNKITLAGCRSTPYMGSPMAFSRKSISAWAGLMNLCNKRNYINVCCCVCVRGHMCEFDCWNRIPVCGMQLYYSLLQLFTLIGCKNNFTDIVVLVEIWVIIAKCWLNCVWTQQNQDVWWTGQSTNQNIFPQLKTQEISERIRQNSVFSQHRKKNMHKQTEQRQNLSVKCKSVRKH